MAEEFIYVDNKKILIDPCWCFWVDVMIAVGRKVLWNPYGEYFGSDCPIMIIHNYSLSTTRPYSYSNKPPEKHRGRLNRTMQGLTFDQTDAYVELLKDYIIEGVKRYSILRVDNNTTDYFIHKDGREIAIKFKESNGKQIAYFESNKKDFTPDHTPIKKNA